MEADKNVNNKSSVFSGILSANEAAPAPAHEPVDHKTAVPEDQVEALNKKIELVEKTILGQMEEKLAEKAPVPPPPPHQHVDLCSKVAELGEKLAALRARAEAAERSAGSPESRGPGPGSFNAASLEGRMKSLEAGLANELKERFSALDPVIREFAGRARLAQETADGNARRIEELEERVAHLSYMKDRLGSSEGKLERIYELEALTHSLELSVERMGSDFHKAMRDSALMSSEHKKTCSDLESLSHQVKHLSALFNHFRTELAFLMPKKQESSGR